LKITRIKAHALSVPLGATYWVSNETIAACGQIVVEVETDEGVVGYGTLHGRSVPVVLEIVRELDAYLNGMDALAHEAVWQKIFNITVTSPGDAVKHNRPQLFNTANRTALLAALGGIDIALWDIKGKAANLPIWRLLGGTRKEIYAYVTGVRNGPRSLCYRRRNGRLRRARIRGRKNEGRRGGFEDRCCAGEGRARCHRPAHQADG
jgi:L-alanine-DL-glutamate epimerase-like enolase superfamily enzyme